VRSGRATDFSDLVLREYLSGRLNRYAADWRNGHCGLREYVPNLPWRQADAQSCSRARSRNFLDRPWYAQDTASGEKIFVQCKACHQIGENAKNAVDPVLNGLFGRQGWDD